MKKAFTLLEIVLVLVIRSIIISVSLPNNKTQYLQEAAVQLVSHIRYSQHLAITDDKFVLNDSEWYKKRWQIIFGESVYTEGKIAYSIFADTSGSSTGKPDISEIAINPLDKSKLLTGGYSGIIRSIDSRATQDMNIGKKYSITSYKLSGGCSYSRIAFDNLGRPLTGNIETLGGAYSASSQRLITQTCKIILSDSENNISISIEPESGYTYIN